MSSRYNPPEHFRARIKLALHLMLEGKSPADVCTELKIKHLSTLQRWMAMPGWKALWDAERAIYGLTDAQLVQRARRALLLKADEAVQTIDEIRRAGTNERNQLTAALSTYKYAVGVAQGPSASPLMLSPDLIKRLLDGLLESRDGRPPLDITPDRPETRQLGSTDAG